MARHLPFRDPDHCIDCGSSDKATVQWRCRNCRHQVRDLQKRALQAVNDLLNLGGLLPAKDLPCVDCEAPAYAFEHRDYRKPFDVEPICYSCNARRGPAAWRNYSEQGAAL